MNLYELEQVLRESFADLRLSGAEKHELHALAAVHDQEQRRFLRNRAFDIYRELINTSASTEKLFHGSQWLERVIKTLDTAPAQWASPQVYFSPGDECLHAVINFCHQARKRLDICVFTISDNRLADAIVSAFERGVHVRVITDDDKSFDKGSDVNRLARRGVSVRMDSTSAHMHHKFAIADGTSLLNGSFNWTRSASERNQENVLITHDPRATAPYGVEFEKLWQQFK